MRRWQTRMTRLAFGLVLLSPGGSTGENGDAALAGIEKLHRQDVAATVPGDPRLLAELWTDDAVRINPGGRIDVGKAAIRAADERATARHPGGRVTSYAPEIKDVRIAGEWAFEWGRFSASYKETETAAVKPVRGTVLRVLRRQGDGSWKFARVMVDVEEPR
jgi:uncharacterized protein (TIGR02246 family)